MFFFRARYQSWKWAPAGCFFLLGAKMRKIQEIWNLKNGSKTFYQTSGLDKYLTHTHYFWRPFQKMADHGAPWNWYHSELNQRFFSPGILNPMKKSSNKSEILEIQQLGTLPYEWWFIMVHLESRISVAEVSQFSGCVWWLLRLMNQDLSSNKSEIFEIQQLGTLPYEWWFIMVHLESRISVAEVSQFSGCVWWLLRLMNQDLSSNKSEKRNPATWYTPIWMMVHYGSFRIQNFSGRSFPIFWVRLMTPSFDESGFIQQQIRDFWNPATWYTPIWMMVHYGSFRIQNFSGRSFPIFWVRLMTPSFDESGFIQQQIRDFRNPATWYTPIWMMVHYVSFRIQNFSGRSFPNFWVRLMTPSSDESGFIQQQIRDFRNPATWYTPIWMMVHYVSFRIQNFSGRSFPNFWVRLMTPSSDESGFIQQQIRDFWNPANWYTPIWMMVHYVSFRIQNFSGRSFPNFWVRLMTPSSDESGFIQQQIRDFWNPANWYTPIWMMVHYVSFRIQNFSGRSFPNFWVRLMTPSSDESGFIQQQIRDFWNPANWYTPIWMMVHYVSFRIQNFSGRSFPIFWVRLMTPSFDESGFIQQQIRDFRNPANWYTPIWMMVHYGSFRIQNFSGRSFPIFWVRLMTPSFDESGFIQQQIRDFRNPANWYTPMNPRGFDESQRIWSESPTTGPQGLGPSSRKTASLGGTQSAEASGGRWGAGIYTGWPCRKIGYFFTSKNRIYMIYTYIWYIYIYIIYIYMIYIWYIHIYIYPLVI